MMFSWLVLGPGPIEVDTSGLYRLVAVTFFCTQEAS